MDDARKLYFGTNTKMYKTISDTKIFLDELRGLSEDIDPDKVNLFVIPSFTALYEARKILNATKIKLGAQNMCWEDSGEYTGEISPLMLQEIGIDIVEIGHSERRHIFGETDIQIEKKVKAAIGYNMTSLLCIGETLGQKEYGISDEELSMQLKIGLHSIERNEADKVWIAYEPVWAIGVNGVPICQSYAMKRHAHIRGVLRDMYGEKTGGNIPILYGGSVNIDNAEELMSDPNINGLFVGRSAWDAKNFDILLRSIL